MLEALGEQDPGAVAEVAGERARVGAKHREDQVDAARERRLFSLGCWAIALDEPRVAQHAEEREERERHEAVRLLARHVADELEHLGRRDAIELGAELERAERVEERALRDLALRGGEERVEEAVGHARQAEHAVGRPRAIA